MASDHVEIARTSKELITKRIRFLLDQFESRNKEQTLIIQRIKEQIDANDPEWIQTLVANTKTLLFRDKCVFCGSTDDLGPTRLVPKARGGPIQPINLAIVCSQCSTSKGERGAFEWWVREKGHTLSVPLEIQYLATLYIMHKSANTLEMNFAELHRYCDHCKALDACPGELSTLCVEGVIALRVKR